MDTLNTTITNPLIDLPLNTKRIYIMAKTPKGCEVYMPVDHEDDGIIDMKKRQLQTYLNSMAPEPDEPMLA